MNLTEEDMPIEPDESNGYLATIKIVKLGESTFSIREQILDNQDKAKLWEKLEGDCDTGMTYQEDLKNYKIVKELTAYAEMYKDSKEGIGNLLEKILGVGANPYVSDEYITALKIIKSIGISSQEKRHIS